MQIIIFEGNTPELIADNKKSSLELGAETYARALKTFDENMDIEIARPYFPDFDVNKIQWERLDGAVFTGSGVSWSTADLRAKPQQKVMEMVFRHAVPTLGSCNGLQLAAVVLGGDVNASPNGLEVGFASEIALTSEGAKHPYHKGRKAPFAVPCVHRDEVSALPEGAVLTATNFHSQVQAMVYEKAGVCFWGTQYHPEFALDDMITLLEKPGVFRGAQAKINEMKALKVGPTNEGNNPDPSDFDNPYRGTEIRNWVKFLRKVETETENQRMESA